MFRTKCGCEWPAGCNGTGTLYCDGCGGDICVCICGGEMECPGCDLCEETLEIGREIEAEEFYREIEDEEAREIEDEEAYREVEDAELEDEEVEEVEDEG